MWRLCLLAGTLRGPRGTPRAEPRSSQRFAPGHPGRRVLSPEATPARGLPRWRCVQRSNGRVTGPGRGCSPRPARAQHRIGRRSRTGPRSSEPWCVLLTSSAGVRTTISAPRGWTRSECPADARRLTVAARRSVALVLSGGCRRQAAPSCRRRSAPGRLGSVLYGAGTHRHRPLGRVCRGSRWRT